MPFHLSPKLMLAITCLACVFLLYAVMSGFSYSELYTDVASPFKSSSADVPEKGVKKDETQMFPFANNRCDVRCCGKSDLLCEGGCVCKTAEQDALLLSRGSNNTGAKEI